MPHSALETLTNREREVLGLIGQGFSLAEIADQLYRSQKTIQTHRLSLGRKLGASNRVELARIAIQAGLAPLEPDAGAAGAPGPSDAPNGGWGIFQAIETALPAVGGPAYFHQLARCLSGELGVRSAGICELSEDRQSFHTLALIDNGKLAEDIIYSVAGSACSHTLEERATIEPEDAGQTFPEDMPLRNLGGEAYVGVRLDSVAGKAIGVLWAVHDRPIDRPQLVLDAMQLCAKRAAAELQRWRALDQLRETREHLEERVKARTAELAKTNRQLAESMARAKAAQAEAEERGARFEALVEMLGDGFVVLDREARIRYANRRFAQIIGREDEQITGHRPDQWMAPEDARVFAQRFKQETGGKYYCTYRLPSGRSTRALVSAKPIYDRHGEHDGSFAVISELPLPPDSG